MSTETDTLPLAAEFPPASREDWRKLVDGVLKGASFDRLVAKTYDGLRIEPIYQRARDGRSIPGRALQAPWQVMQRIDDPDPARANAQALHDLENGATGLTLVFAGANGAYGLGLDPSPDALARVLDGVHLDAGIAIELQIGPQSRDVPQQLLELAKRRRTAPAALTVRAGLSPIGAAATAGGSPAPWSAIATAFGETVRGLAASGLRGPLAAADGRVIHDAGGSEAEELAFVLAETVAYLRALENAGLALDEARRLIYARLSADADQFLTMAKFRALRLLWARVEESCGLAPQPLFIAADTAWRMLTQRDCDVNMLRATIATVAAGLGGADAVTVLPHTLALGLPDGFARRIARNTQLVLLEESNLAKVSDPAAGSGGIEALTKALCEAAWAQFQDIEKAGGAFAALERNLIQGKVAAVRAARDADLARRKQVLTGASEFPNLAERRPEVLPATPVALPPHGEPAIAFDALAPIRLAVPFEKLRDRSDRILAETGRRPAVFLANLGTAADFTARATFAKSFFETGGIAALEGDGTPHLTAEAPADFSALVTAFKASGTALACLCSSDKVYAGHAAAAAQALHAAGARHIYLAGRPGELEAPLKEAGVTDFIFAGCDALATLDAAYGKVRAA